MTQATVNVRMDEGLKKQLRLSSPLPFKAIEDMSKEEFNEKIQVGLDAIAVGQVRPVEDAFRDMQRKYGL